MVRHRELQSAGVDERRSPPEERAAPDPRADMLLRLQRGAGNAAVGHLLRDELAPAPRAIARLKTSAQFVTHSTGLIERDRSTELQEVDTALADYDLVRNDTLEKRERALYTLAMKIQLWKDSKKTPNDPQAWTKSHRKHAIKVLTAEQAAELQAVQDAMQQAADVRAATDAQAKKDKLDALVTSQIKAMTDSAAKAKTLFGVYMDTFRGRAKYTTTTPKGTTVWDDSGTVACSMISRGLVDLLGHAGVTAKVVEIATRNFLTKKLGAEFIDPATEGNVRLPGGSFADEKRFFFNKHWIVEVESGALYLDPTSGLEVGKDAPEIVEHVLSTTESPSPPTYSDGTWRATHIGSNKLGDGAYELTRVGANDEDSGEA